MSSILRIGTFAVFACACACGPTAEEKALKQERVDLLAMQHEALAASGKQCSGAQKQLDGFASANKERIAKYKAQWDALDKKKQEKLLDMKPQSDKAVYDEILALMISCPGIKLPLR